MILSGVKNSECILKLISLSILSIFLSCCANPDEDEENASAYELKTSDESAGSIPNDDYEWKLLFDENSTSGWRRINEEFFPKEGWKVEDGVFMVNASDGQESGNGGDIITTNQYGDFILDWEWKMMTKGGNSGVKYFVKEGLSDNEKYGAGLEYQILDDENHEWMLQGKMKPGDYHTLASLYEIYPARDKLPKPLGEWNRSKIVVDGKHVEHWLNGSKVLAFERGGEDFKKRVAQSKFNKYENFGEAKEGHILLQDHGSEVLFRNMRIKELD